MNTALIPGQHVHIVGIGGFGMSAIARVLLENGYLVSGSDQKMNPLMEALRRDGATIYVGHAAEQIKGAEVVLMSTAVPEDNPEILRAQQLDLPVMERRDVLTSITEGQQTIAIAGTHGKTTTTAMLTHVLSEAGLDPSFIVGGIMRNRGTNAGAGLGEHFVIEADEYGHMFLGLQPQIAVITNVEFDHPDFFSAPDELLLAFRLFAERVAPTGLLIACADDDVAQALVQERRALLYPAQTYGIENKAADWWASDLSPTADGGMEFVVHRGESMTGGVIGPARISLIGAHNVQNAMAVIAVADHLGVPFGLVVEALASFKGTERRSEIMGEAGGVRVVNDYAHHPTAISATLRAWRAQLGRKGDLWAVWQPHTYSRSRALADSFSVSFGAAQHVLVTDIYAAREEATPGLFAKDLAALITSEGQHPDAKHSGDLMSTAQILADGVKSGDVVVLLTAGDAPQIGVALLDVLLKREGF